MRLLAKGIFGLLLITIGLVMVTVPLWHRPEGWWLAMFITGNALALPASYFLYYGFFA